MTPLDDRISDPVLRSALNELRAKNGLPPLDGAAPAKAEPRRAVRAVSPAPIPIPEPVAAPALPQGYGPEFTSRDLLDALFRCQAAEKRFAVVFRRANKAGLAYQDAKTELAEATLALLTIQQYFEARRPKELAAPPAPER